MIAVLLRIAKSRDFNFLNLTWKFLPKSDRGRGRFSGQSLPLFTQSQELSLMVRGGDGGRDEPDLGLFPSLMKLCLLFPGHQPLGT